MTNDLTFRSGAEARAPRLSQHQHLLHPSKTDEIEVLESGGMGEEQHETKITAGWICCMPCVWLRTSATVHKLAITMATLLVTSLLVASPVLFLLSTAPSQLPKDCNTKNDFNCLPTRAPTPECNVSHCRVAALSIQARMNWKADPCTDFGNFSCSLVKGSIKAARSAQEGVDLQMQNLLTHNTTAGTFQKLGRLYESCLRQTVNSTTVLNQLIELGGYIGINELPPTSIGPLLIQISRIGPMPLLALYFDLSYGKKPQSMLVVDSSLESAAVLQNSLRWTGPKSAPFDIRYDVPPLLDKLLEYFLPESMTLEEKFAERDNITKFIRELNQLRRESFRKEFADSYVLYNVSSLTSSYPFIIWEDLVVPPNWSGPILVRSGSYLSGLQQLITRHTTRVAHNAILMSFALGILPEKTPNAVVCTKATMWAMPEVASAFFVAQFPEQPVQNVIVRTEKIFEVLKAHLKRAPSLKGAALVKLSQLKVQATIWPKLYNLSEISDVLDQLDIKSDNWFKNILNIYKTLKAVPNSVDINNQGGQTAWAYPTVAKIFYDTLSHSIVVPLSIMTVPYFDANLPHYLHYASVGVSIAKEILRSITKAFDSKVINCVPSASSVFSNASQMDLLLHSGGMQISYHSLLSLAGPIKGMVRLPGINLTPTQIFFLMTAQELCSNAAYIGVDTRSPNFSTILGWLIKQGGSGTSAFQCSSSSYVGSFKSCPVL